MSRLPPENFLSSQAESASPGSKVYLYRTLRLLASTNTSGQFQGQPAYRGAKQLAVRLALHSPDGLAAFFKDLGLGNLRHEISRERLKLTLSGESTAAAGAIDDGSCDFERGLIDGALEFITGMPVTTGEVSCRKHGAAECTFEARLQADPGPPCYLPAAGAGVFPGVSPIPSVNFMTPGNLLDMRSWYLDLAGRELARAKRHNRLLALLYIDLDDLGEINQTYGRKAGDQVIGAVAAALGKGCRCEDFIWHHGEDEFAVLLAETDPLGAKTVAGRLALQIFSAAEFVDVSAKVSASIGMALFPKHSETIHGLLIRAKSALYMAKACGKGLVHEAEGPEDIARPYRDGTAGGQTLSRDSEDSQRLGGNANRRAGEERSRARVDLNRVDGAGLPPEQSEGAPRKASDDPRGRAAGVNRRGQGSGKVAGAARQRQAGSDPAATVLLASISPVLIAGMKQVISSESTAGEGAMTMTREITDSQKLSNAVLDTRPDLIFSDMNMATAADFTFPKLLNEENLPCKLVVFANDVSPDVLKLVTDYSIDGVILQQTPTAEALEALKSIYLGKQFLPEQVRAAMLQLEDSRRLLGDLSERELEVLRLVAEGKSNSQISEELYITVNTVRFHLANVYQKLGVGNRTEAAKYYLRQDLAPNGQTKLL